LVCLLPPRSSCSSVVGLVRVPTAERWFPFCATLPVPPFVGTLRAPLRPVLPPQFGCGSRVGQTYAPTPRLVGCALRCCPRIPPPTYPVVCLRAVCLGSPATQHCLTFRSAPQLGCTHVYPRLLDVRLRSGCTFATPVWFGQFGLFPPPHLPTSSVWILPRLYTAVPSSTVWFLRSSFAPAFTGLVSPTRVVYLHCCYVVFVVVTPFAFVFPVCVCSRLRLGWLWLPPQFASGLWLFEHGCVCSHPLHPPPFLDTFRRLFGYVCLFLRLVVDFTRFAVWLFG